MTALLIGLVAITAFMVFALVRERIDRPRFASGDPAAARLWLYTRTMLIHSSLASACVLSWWLAGLDLEALGFQVGPGGWRTGATWGATLLALARAALMVVSAARSDEVRARVRDHLESAGKLDLIRPSNAVEARRFRAVALTVGICEEITFRGFLLGAVALAAPVWIAALFSVALFVIAHAYQGLQGMLRVVPFSVALTALFLLGQSLWPVMILHVVADLLGGEMARNSAL